MTSEVDKKYIVIYKKKPILQLNRKLAEIQGISDDALDKIKELHRKKAAVYEEIEDILQENGKVEKLDGTMYNLYLTQIEYELQDNWGFPRNTDFHKFWNVPGCQCPRLDNQDRYPLGNYYRSHGCPFHGS